MSDVIGQMMKHAPPVFVNGFTVFACVNQHSDDLDLASGHHQAIGQGARFVGNNCRRK